MNLPFEPTELVFDLHRVLVKATEFDRAVVNIPQLMIDLFETDVLTTTGLRNINPTMVPTDAAIGTHIAHFEVIGILERRDCVG